MPPLTPRQIIAEMHADGETTEAMRAEIKTRLDIDVSAERIAAARLGKRLPIGDAPAEPDSDPITDIGVKQPVTNFTDEEAAALLSAAAAAPETPALDSAVAKLNARAAPPEDGVPTTP